MVGFEQVNASWERGLNKISWGIANEIFTFFDRSQFGMEIKLVLDFLVLSELWTDGWNHYLKLPSATLILQEKRHIWKTKNNNTLIHNFPKWSEILLKSCSKGCRIKTFLNILGRHALLKVTSATKLFLSQNSLWCVIINFIWGKNVSFSRYLDFCLSIAT